MKDMILFKKYIKDISKHPLITKDDEIELSKRIMQKDNDALQRLINANLKLVVKISLEFYKGSASIMDIIQNGNMGLIKAAKKFDYKRGVKFSTYAAFWIKQSILRGFIKPSYNLNISYRKDTINKKIKSYVTEFCSKNNRFPQADEIVSALQVNRRDAVDILFFFQNSDFSLNDMVYNDTEEFIDTVSDDTFNPEKIAEFQSLLDEINGAMSAFSKREQTIIRKRYGFDDSEKETLNTLGRHFSITAEAARQIEKRVLNNIKNRFPELSYYIYSG